MKAFVRDALQHLGGEVEDAGSGLRARLPEDAEVTRRLGGRELLLVFDTRELRPGAELVAPGSHVLRGLEEILTARGQRCYLERPARHRLTKQAARAVVTPGRGLDLTLGERVAEAGWDLYVTYRVLYRTLACVDAVEAVRVRLRPWAAPQVELAEPPGAEAAEWEARPRKQAAPDALDQGLAAADAFVAARARLEAARLAEEASGQLARELSRLHAFYSGQIAETERGRRSDAATLRIEELEEERELRVRELVAASRVAVDVEPLQLLTVEVPLQSAPVVLHPRKSAPEGDAVPAGTLWLDRATGETIWRPLPAV